MFHYFTNMSPPPIGNKSQGEKSLPCRPKGTITTDDKNCVHLHTTDAITIKTGIFSNFVSILISILVGRLEGTGGRERRFSGRDSGLCRSRPTPHPLLNIPPPSTPPLEQPPTLPQPLLSSTLIPRLPGLMYAPGLGPPALSYSWHIRTCPPPQGLPHY